VGKVITVVEGRLVVVGGDASSSSIGGVSEGWQAARISDGVTTVPANSHAPGPRRFIPAVVPDRVGAAAAVLLEPRPPAPKRVSVAAFRAGLASRSRASSPAQEVSSRPEQLKPSASALRLRPVV